MAAPSYTYTITNGTAADASQVTQNFNDILNGVTDGTKDLTVNALEVNGALQCDGHVTLGNGSGDDITVTGSIASSIAIKTQYSYDFGSATAGIKSIYFGSSDAAARGTRLIGATVAADWTLTLPTAVPTAAGKFLAATTAGVSSWAYPYSRVSKAFADTPYTLLASDTHVDVDTSGGAVTVTVPAASSTNSGQTVWIRKTTSDLTAVTLATGVSTTLNTIGEVVQIQSNGTAWAIINRHIDKRWTTFTPTGSWSTNTTYTGAWRRVGDCAEIKVSVITSGAPTSATLTVNMPTGLVIDSAKLFMSGSENISQIGYGNARDNGTAAYLLAVLYNGDTGKMQPFVIDASGTYTSRGSLTQAVPFTFGNTDGLEFTCSMPISGWNG